MTFLGGFGKTSRCPKTGKLQYLSKIQAEEACSTASRKYGKSRVYKCPHCDEYHLATVKGAKNV